MSFLEKLFSPEGFMPHGHRYVWETEVMWLHIISDAFIALAYLTIPVTLIYLARKRKYMKRTVVPFNWMFACFAIFILACGASHALEVVTIWEPLYRLSGLIKAVTALASISTAILLIKLIPKFLALPNPATLQAANEALAREVVERQRAEAETRELQAQHALILNSMSEGIHWIDKDGRIVFENPASARMLGWDAAELVGRPAHGTMHHTHANGTAYPQTECPIYASLRDGQPRSGIREVFWRKDGTSFPVEYTASPARNAAGEIAGTVVVFADVSRREQAAKTLADLSVRTEQRERLLTKMLSFISDFTYIFDREGRFLFANKPLLDLWGLTLEQVIGRTFQQLNYPEELAAKLLNQIEEVFDTGRNVTDETPYTSPAGLPGVYEYIFTPAYTEDGTVGFVVGCTRDITARKQAEAALRASEAEFRVLAEAMPQIIWVTRPDGWHTHFNQRWIDYTGLTLEESLGHGWLPPFHPEDQPMAAKRWKHANDTGDAYEIEYRLRGVDGDYRWMLGRAVPLRDEAGLIVKWFGTCTDIHDLKMAEQNIRALNTDLEQRVWQRTGDFLVAAEEAERANRAKSEFLSRTSHELRTPLNAILGFGQLLEGEQSLGAEPRESVEEILQAGRHLLSLVDEVLDISTAESGAMTLALEPVPVDQLMTETLGLVGSQDGALKIDVELGTPLGGGWSVLADPQRLKQVLLNLLSNAIKYNRPGGKVIVKFAPVEAVDPPVFRFSVQDTGPGISPEKLSRLFTPFDRLDAERTKTHIAGTGLGLALSRQLTELMGGRIGVESVQEEGSTFWVELPLAQSPAASIERNKSIPDSAPGFPPSRTILYIEDNDSNLRLVTRILARRPAIHLLTATTGTLGLEMALEHRPDFILLDLNLPGLNGDEVLAALRADPRTSDIPVAMLTADGRPATRERMLATGARAFLTKPLDVRDLLQVVDQWLPVAIQLEVSRKSG